MATNFLSSEKPTDNNNSITTQKSFKAFLIYPMFVLLITTDLLKLVKLLVKYCCVHPLKHVFS